MESINQVEEVPSLHYVVQRPVFFIAGCSIFNLIHIFQRFILTGQQVDFSTIWGKNLFSHRFFFFFWLVPSVNPVRNQMEIRSYFKGQTNCGHQGEIKEDGKKINNFLQLEAATRPFYCSC